MSSVFATSTDSRIGPAPARSRNALVLAGLHSFWYESLNAAPLARMLEDPFAADSLSFLSHARSRIFAAVHASLPRILPLLRGASRPETEMSHQLDRVLLSRLAWRDPPAKGTVAYSHLRLESAELLRDAWQTDFVLGSELPGDQLASQVGTKNAEEIIGTRIMLDVPFPYEPEEAAHQRMVLGRLAEGYAAVVRHRMLSVVDPDRIDRVSREIRVLVAGSGA